MTIPSWRLPPRPLCARRAAATPWRLPPLPPRRAPGRPGLGAPVWACGVYGARGVHDEGGGKRCGICTNGRPFRRRPPAAHPLKPTFGRRRQRERRRWGWRRWRLEIVPPEAPLPHAHPLFNLARWGVETFSPREGGVRVVDQAPDDAATTATPPLCPPAPLPPPPPQAPVTTTAAPPLPLLTTAETVWATTQG